MTDGKREAEQPGGYSWCLTSSSHQGMPSSGVTHQACRWMHQLLRAPALIALDRLWMAPVFQELMQMNWAMTACDSCFWAISSSSNAPGMHDPPWGWTIGVFVPYCKQQMSDLQAEGAPMICSVVNTLQRELNDHSRTSALLKGEW